MRPARILVVAAVAVAFALLPGVTLASTRSVVEQPPSLAINDWPCWPDMPCPTLTVSLAGNGSGTWKTTSSLGGAADGLIDCHVVNGVVAAGSICSRMIRFSTYTESITIYYTAIADAGSQHCDGTVGCGQNVANYFVLQAASNPYVKSGDQFKLLSYPVTVTSAPAGINFGATGSAMFVFGSTVTLTATAEAGAYFAGWTGRCAGQGPTCPLTVQTTGNTTNAVFQFGAPPTPTAGPKVTPRPIVTPRVTLGPGVTAAPPAGTPGPGATGPGATDPGSSAEPNASAGPSAPLPAGVTSLPTQAPTIPAANVASPDLTPIAIAILGAGLIVALGVGLAIYASRRRTSGPAP